MNIDFENEVLDLGALKEDQLLNENILHVFAAWIEYLLSKNPEASSLSAKCAIAVRMMNAKTIQRNIKSSFPLIASQEIRFYESSGFIIFK